MQCKPRLPQAVGTLAVIVSDNNFRHQDKLTTTKKYTTGFVTSTDGTKIHYRQIGSGKGLVLVHGGMMYSQNFMTLAELLANDFTVYIPDRCGRGLSETHKNYSLLAESEDIQAILNQTDTQNAFGLSSGAIIVLQTAIVSSALKKIALYEPPIFIDNINNNHLNKIFKNYECAITNQNYGKAFINFLKGTDDNGSLIKLLPNFITVPLMNVALNLEAKKKLNEDEVPLKSLIAALQYDNQVANQSHGIIEKIKAITADILLLGGEKSQTFLKEVLDKLNIELPKAKRITFPKIGHIAAHNEGKPELVANELRNFFKTT